MELCPNCGSTDIDPHDQDFDPPTIRVNYFCFTCGELWTEVYTHDRTERGE